MDIDEKLKEIEIELFAIHSFFKSNIEEMLAGSPVNTIESEKAKFCSKFLYKFIENRIQYFDNDTANSLMESISTIKGFFEILEAYENEQIEKFKGWMIKDDGKR